MTEVNRRNFSSRSDSENLMDSEKLKMVMDIVGITQVSQDQALFALHDSDFNLVLALENVMKGKPDDQVMQKTSRRKKVKESEDTTAGDKNSDANNKNHKGGAEKTDSSKKSAGNRKQNSAANKSKEPEQQVKPLMEIQTGNWGDTENRLALNGSMSGSHGNRSGEGRRGSGRGRGRGGLSRGGGFSGSDRTSNRRGPPSTEEPQHSANTHNGLADENTESSQQSFPQPFVVGTFDAKTMENPDTEQSAPSANEGRPFGGGGSENRFGGGAGRGRGRFSGRGGGNRNSNPRDNRNRGDNSEAPPVPLFDNLWSAEEKWDVKSDGDWRGREFTPTVSNEVIKCEEDITSSSAAAYFSNTAGGTGAPPNLQPDGSGQESNMATQQAMLNQNAVSTLVQKGPLSNGEVDCTMQPTTKVNEEFSSSMFDPRVNANKTEESDNFLLKLLGQQVTMDSQVSNMHLSSSTSKMATEVDQHSRGGGAGTNGNTTTNGSSNNGSGTNVKNHQFMNMSMNANNSMNDRPSGMMSAAPSVSVPTHQTPDVPPGFAETLNTENLEFGSPPSTFQATATRKQPPPPTHIPAAPVELPSPVSSFSIGTPVNFGEIDPRYLNRHQYNNMNTAKPQNNSNNSVEFFTRKFAANPAVSFVNTPESPSRNSHHGSAIPKPPMPEPVVATSQGSLEAARTESISSRPSPGKQPAPETSPPTETPRLGYVVAASAISSVTQNQRPSTGSSGLAETSPPNVPASTSNVITSTSNSTQEQMNKFNQRTMSAQPLHPQTQQQQQSQQPFLYQLPASSSGNTAKTSQILNNVELQSKEVSPVQSKTQGSSVYYSGNGANASGTTFNKLNSRSSPADQQQRLQANSMSGFSRPANSLSKSNQQSPGDSGSSGSKLGSGSNNSLNTNVASFINAAASQQQQQQQQQQIANAMSAMGITSPTNYQMGYMSVDGNERTSNQIQQLMSSTNSSRYQLQQSTQQQQQSQHQMNSSGGSNPAANLSQQYQMVTAANSVAVMQNGPSNYGPHFSQSAANQQALHPSLAANMVAMNTQQSPSSQLKSSSESGGHSSGGGGGGGGAPMGHYNMNLSSGASLQSNSSTTAAEVSKMMSNPVSSNVRRLNNDDNSSSMGAATSTNSTHVASTSVQHAQNLAQNPAATPLPFFLATAAHPYHAAATSFPPSNAAAAATAFYPQAMSAFLNNPAAQAMFQTFNLPQLQAQLQQQQSPGASVQPASSSAQQTLKSQQQLSMGAHNGPSNTSQQAFANSGQMGNSYFQGAQNSDYMSGGGASSVSGANEYKYGGSAASQQQQLGPQSAAAAAAAIGAYASRSSSGAAGAMATNASNKTNLYGNSSDYSALYAKGLDKSGGNVGGLNAPGMASTSPPQAAANANFSNYMPAAFGAQAAAVAAAAGSPQIYSQQQFLNAAAAQNLITTHDPRASAVGGSLKPVSGLGPASSTLHSKHATGQHSGPVSSFASNNFNWHN